MSLRIVRMIAVGLAFVLACGGCVLRKEVITVARDASVVIELEYTGTKEELTSGDAMPSEESGWPVEWRKSDDKKDEYELTAARRFEPREELPASFASRSDPDADLYLRFPTTLRVERKPDGLYYYFRRVYEPRRWAYIQYWQNLCIDDEIKKLSDKPVNELTVKERGQIIKALATLEALKQAECAEIAVGEGFPAMPVEDQLAARRALLAVYSNEDDSLDRVLTACEGLDEEETGACYDTEAKRLLDAGYRAFVESLQNNAGMDAAQISQFARAYDRARRYFEITDALGGHAFQIDVHMPGTIIAHNAVDDDVETDGSSSSIRFEFDGTAFRDRPQELIVVSRVDEGSGR